MNWIMTTITIGLLTAKTRRELWENLRVAMMMILKIREKLL
jgi:hypothetical protein